MLQPHYYNIYFNINDNLQQLADILFSRWFLQFEFPNKDGKPYRSHQGVFEYNKQLKRQIPKDWKVVNIKDLCQLTWGQCPEGKNILDLASSSENTMFYCSGAGDMRNGIVVDCQALTNASRRIAKKGDILMSGAGSIGALAICDKTISLGRAAVSFRPQENHLAFCYLMIKKYVDRIKSISSGSIQKVINDAHIDDINFAFHPEIVDKFQFVNQMITQCVSLELENRQLKELRDELVPLLMNGQVSLR